MPGADSDITSTLSDLERKLQALETELATVGDPAAAIPAPVAPPVAPLPTDPPAPLVGLYGQMAELERFRETLEASARALVEEYRRLLTHVQVTDAPPAAAPPAVVPTLPPLPTLPPTPPAPPVAAAPVVSEGDGPSITGGWAPTAPIAHVPPPAAVAPLVDIAPPPPAPEVPAAIPAAGGAGGAPVGADPTVQGQLTVDAGPFADIGTLSQFEQALGRLPGAQDVYVKGFEGDRALVDVTLSGPVAFATQLRQISPLAVTVHEPVAGSNQLKVDVQGASDA